MVCAQVHRMACTYIQLSAAVVAMYVNIQSMGLGFDEALWDTIRTIQ